MLVSSLETASKNHTILFLATSNTKVDVPNVGDFFNFCDLQDKISRESVRANVAIIEKSIQTSNFAASFSVFYMQQLYSCFGAGSGCWWSYVYMCFLFSTSHSALVSGSCLGLFGNSQNLESDSGLPNFHLLVNILLWLIDNFQALARIV